MEYISVQHGKIVLIKIVFIFAVVCISSNISGNSLGTNFIKPDKTLFVNLIQFLVSTDLSGAYLYHQRRIHRLSTDLSHSSLQTKNPKFRTSTVHGEIPG